jgi:hypothetical protein
MECNIYAFICKFMLLSIAEPTKDCSRKVGISDGRRRGTYPPHSAILASLLALLALTLAKE